MIELPRYRTQLKIKPYRKFLEEHGAEMLPPTGEWEVFRYRPRGETKGASIVYMNKKQMLNWQVGNAGAHYRAYVAGLDPFKQEPTTEEQKPRRLSLYTDAGYDHTTHSGGWGAVLFCEAVLDVEASGILKRPVLSSTSAEMRAVANALHHFLKSGDIVARDSVCIVCDNINVINALNFDMISKKRDIGEAHKAIKDLIVKFELAISTRWVKGHQSPLNSHDARINNRCDRLAAEHRRAA